MKNSANHLRPDELQLVVLRVQEFASGEQRRQRGQNGEDRPAAGEDVLEAASETGWTWVRAVVYIVAFER